MVRTVTGCAVGISTLMPPVPQPVRAGTLVRDNGWVAVRLLNDEDFSRGERLYGRQVRVGLRWNERFMMATLIRW